MLSQPSDTITTTAPEAPPPRRTPAVVELLERGAEARLPDQSGRRHRRPQRDAGQRASDVALRREVATNAWARSTAPDRYR